VLLAYEVAMKYRRTPRRALIAGLLLALCAAPAAAQHVLVDASRDGGLWWGPQAAPPYDPNLPHQGKALADLLRSQGMTVTELARPFTITCEQLSQYDLVVTIDWGAAYSASERSAYNGYVANGGHLIYLTDHQTFTVDSLSSLFGLDFNGSLTGTITPFTPHPITAGVNPLAYPAGSFVATAPSSAKMLGFVSGQPVMGILAFDLGRVFFMGETNLLEGFPTAIPQPLVNNLFGYMLAGAQRINACSRDTDNDTLPDGWETRFGLSPASATGSDGASGDPDGDGVTNLDEYRTGKHPRGFFTRYLAEGALNTFFDTRLALLNVGTDPARVLMRFLQPGGVTLPLFEPLASGRRRTLTRIDLNGLVSPDFSTVVESDQPIVVDRTMSWDASGYGSHAESGVASPATTWYLAEGSTSGDFALFYLLQNPNPTATTATVRYLRPLGQPPIERQYSLAPNSRTTIPVDDEGPELASTDVSAVISAGQPIIVERAMYMTRMGQAFSAGHGSAGVTAPATSWFLAEGATGPFFDLFVLLANPTAQAAEVTVDYLLLGGTTYTKSYSVPANGRFTIWVDDEQIPAGSGVKPLDNVAVSSTITSTNGVPIIVERAMWWPSPALGPNFWTEAHNSPGATTTATRWALAEGEVGGSQAAETYILIANTSAGAGNARVRLFFEDGTTVDRMVVLPARSRTNVGVSSAFPEAVGRRFGALVESLGATPAQIVVERAMYTSPGGQTWVAGTNALGTPLP
jgi:hypothetical protein